MQINYKLYEALCIERGKAPSTAAVEAGIARNQPGKWKQGGSISPASLRKLATYFDVPMEQLIESPVQTISNISNSSVVAGNRGSVSIGSPALSAMEAELLRIYRELSVRDQMQLMNKALELDDKKKEE